MHGITVRDNTKHQFHRPSAGDYFIMALALLVVICVVGSLLFPPKDSNVK